MSTTSRYHTCAIIIGVLILCIVYKSTRDNVYRHNCANSRDVRDYGTGGRCDEHTPACYPDTVGEDDTLMLKIIETSFTTLKSIDQYRMCSFNAKSSILVYIRGSGDPKIRLVRPMDRSTTAKLEGPSGTY